MTTSLRYEPIPSSGALPDETRIISQAFSSPLEGAEHWIEFSGRELFRRVSDGDRVVGTILLTPMGIYFGGQSVPMMGIAGVAIDPAVRGHGVARWMLEQALQETRDRGVPLAGLYSALHPLYRRVGFEHAGSHCGVSVPLHLLPSSSRRFEAFEEADMDAVKACYHAWASPNDGHLDRGPYCWNRVKNVRGQEMNGYVSRNDAGEVDAYIFCRQKSISDVEEKHVLNIKDFGASSREGLDGLMGFIRGFSSIADRANWTGGMTHPILTALGDRRYSVELKDHWMLRVVDVPGALVARGVRGPDAPAVHVLLEDEVLGDHAVPWVLAVEDGKLTARPGGEGRLRVHVRAVASLYAGFMSTSQLASLGLVEGEPADMAAMDRIFPVGNPTMVDMF